MSAARGAPSLRSTTSPPAEVSSTLRSPRRPAPPAGAAAAAGEREQGHRVDRSQPIDRPGRSPLGGRGRTARPRARTLACPCLPARRPRPTAGGADPADGAAPAGRPALVRLAPVLDELGRRFAGAGHELALVGGPVRDVLLGRPSPDLDFTTDARPEQIAALLRGWADAWWEVGIAFGTVGRAARATPWSR